MDASTLEQLSTELVKATKQLNVLLDRNVELRRLVAENKAAKELFEAKYAIRETHEEGHINGKNSETRKRQLLIELHNEANCDPSYGDIVYGLVDYKKELEQNNADIKKTANSLRLYRDQKEILQIAAGG